jgi:hypothetical protein
VNTLPVGYNGVHVAITGTTGSTLVTAQAANPGVSTVQGQIDYRGTLFGSSFGARAKSGATNLFEVAGVEFDVGIDLGGSSKYLFGVSSSKVGKGSALVFEAAYEVAGGNDVEGWRNALLLTGLHGQPSMSTNGCVICTDGIAQGIRMGIDLSGYTISQYFLRGPGGQFLVDGVGNLSARSVATITPIAVAYGGTGDSGTAWSTFAPTITCVSGSVAGGTYPAQLGRYKTIGKTVFISIDVMAPAGSCSGGVATIAGLPVTAGSNIYMLVGRDESTGKMVQGRIATAATAITVSNYDGATSPAGAGLIMLSGVYETN